MSGVGQEGRARSERAGRVVLLTTLLVVCLGLLFLVSARAARAYLEVRNLRRVQAGGVVEVRPWMTIPYLAHTYHVPEADLFGALGLAPTAENRHRPLRALAWHEGRDLDADIATLTAAIEARRATPPPGAPPTPTRAP